MRPSRGIISTISILAELILQHRIDVKQALLSHLQQFKTGLPLLRTSERWQDELAGLLDSEHYQIKRRITTKDKSITDLISISINLISTCKSSSESRPIETWLLQAQRLHPLLQVQDDSCRDDCLDLLQVLLEALPSQCIFSDIITHPLNKRKFIIDFQIEVHGNTLACRNSIAVGTSYWTKNAIFAQDWELSIQCYHQNSRIRHSQQKFGGTQLSRLPKLTSLSSEQTCPSSNKSSFSRPSIPYLRHRSNEYPSLQSRSFELDEQQFTMIVLSSSDQCEKRSCGWIVELEVEAEQEEEFQLLVDASSFDFESEWIRQNEEFFKKIDAAEHSYFN